MSRLASLFQRDSKQLLDSLEQVIPGLSGDTQAVHQAFRYIHSIRSQAAFLQYEQVADKASEVEDFLGAVRVGEKIADSEFLNDLLKHISELRSMCQNPRAVPARKGSRHVAAVVPKENVLAELLKNVDDYPIFLQQLGDTVRRQEELLVVSVQISEEPEFITQRKYLLLHLLEQHTGVLLHSALESSEDVFLALLATSRKPEFLEDLLKTSAVSSVDVQMVSEARVRAAAESRASYDPGNLTGLQEVQLNFRLREYERLLFGLQYAGMGVPVLQDCMSLLQKSGQTFLGELLNNLRPMAESAAAEQGKIAVCKVLYDDAAVSLPVASVLREALSHLVRNAIDHGIETPHERQAAGKPEAGTVNLSAHVRDGIIRLEVSDDGRGIALEGSSRDILDQITIPGYSTRQQNMNEGASGRGVGLDVVRHSVESLLHGQLELSCRPHTRFSLSIAADLQLLTVIIIQTVQGQNHAIP
ncbi:MAG: hypothetical protein D6B26_08055, partial [Spirochaetaceae bacterium]